MLKTFVYKGDYTDRKWFVVDASGKVLGRMASKIAIILKGKHNPIYSPHIDVGDHVIVLNAGKIHLTGKKAASKYYYRHTGYPGGLKKESFEKLIKDKPERVVHHAIWGMLPHNKLGRKMIKKLKIYSDDKHPHESQKPEILEI